MPGKISPRPSYRDIHVFIVVRGQVAVTKPQPDFDIKTIRAGMEIGDGDEKQKFRGCTIITFRQGKIRDNYPIVILAVFKIGVFRL